jgi:hypothetical protein
MRESLTWFSAGPKDVAIDVVMAAPMTKPALDALLAGLAAGTWVVLDPDMSRILSKGSTPEEAIEKAHISPPTSDKAVGERPVMLQVPDPSMTCFF